MKDAEQGRYEIGIDHRDSMEVEGRSFLIYIQSARLAQNLAMRSVTKPANHIPCYLSKSNFIESGALLLHLRNLENEIKPLR